MNRKSRRIGTSVIDRLYDGERNDNARSRGRFVIFLGIAVIAVLWGYRHLKSAARDKIPPQTELAQSEAAASTNALSGVASTTANATNAKTQKNDSSRSRKEELIDTPKTETCERRLEAEKTVCRKPPKRIPKASAASLIAIPPRIVMNAEPTLNVVIDASRDDWKSADVCSNDLVHAIFTMSR